ncbi:hypothetical protein Hanom_Chr05g00462801 [Helianthus anomalus]
MYNKQHCAGKCYTTSHHKILFSQSVGFRFLYNLVYTDVEIRGYGNEERERVVPCGFKHAFLVSFDGL